MVFLFLYHPRRGGSVVAQVIKTTKAKGPSEEGPFVCSPRCALPRTHTAGRKRPALLSFLPFERRRYAVMKQITDEALKSASAELERDKARLQSIFGDEYVDNPRFADAVKAVASGRTAWLVLADYEDNVDKLPQSTDGGSGWA